MILYVAAIIGALTGRVACPRCRHLVKRDSMERSTKVTCGKCGHLFLKEHYRNRSRFWEK